MLTWIKSLITEVPAGTALVGVSMTLVVTLLVALAEIAGSAPEHNTFAVAGNGRAVAASAQTTVASSLDSLSDSAATADRTARPTTVSVMVPVGAIR